MKDKMPEFHALSGNITDMLVKIKPPLVPTKPYKFDQDRAMYSQLLDFATNYLQKTANQFIKIDKIGEDKIDQLSKEFFFPLFEQMINLSKRQCNEKATILKLLFDFHKQGISTAQKNCQQKIKGIISEFSQNIGEKDEKSSQEIEELKKKLTFMKKQFEQKWKTFYLIVKDNRVLRRQKGKLMRTIQDDKIKIAELNENMAKISRQNEKYKLLKNYETEQEAFSLYLKNTIAVNNLEQYMKEYPKQAKKLLKNDLNLLEIDQQNSLSQKVDYIIKAARQTDDIQDFEQDLKDVEIKNRFLMNAETQTEYIDQAVEVNCTNCKKKTKRYDQDTQTSILTNLVLHSFEIHENIVMKSPLKMSKKKVQRLDSVSTMTKSKGKEKNCFLPVKNLSLMKRVVYAKIPSQVRKKKLELYSQIVVESYHCEVSENKIPTISQIPSQFRISQEMNGKKSKVNKIEHRISRFSGSKQQLKAPKIDINVMGVRSQGIIKSSSNIKSSRSIKFMEPHQRFSNTAQIPQRNSIKIRNSLQVQQKQRNNSFKNNIKKLTIKTEPYELTVNYPQLKINGQQAQKIDQEKSFQSNQTDINIEIKKIQGKRKQTLHQSRNTSKSKNSSKQKQTLKIQNTAKGKLRKSGFCVNLPSKKKKSKNSTNTLKVNNSVASRLSIMNANDTIDAINPTRKQLETNFRLSMSNISTHQKQKKYKSVKQRKINIFSQSSSRVLQKLMKAIFNQRKELTDSKITLEQYIGQHMTNHYGSHFNYSLTNHFTSTSQSNEVAAIFDQLLNVNKEIMFLQMGFGLFAQMLHFNGSVFFGLDSYRALYIMKQIEIIYGQNFQGIQLTDDENLTHLFVLLNTRIEHQLQECELLGFMRMILPKSQNTINYEQILQILSIFEKDETYCRCVYTLKHLKGDISVLKFCILAFRQKWKTLINIQQYIHSRYQEIIGQRKQLRNMLINKCTSQGKSKWLYKLIRRSIEKQGSGLKREFLQKYLTLSIISTEIEKKMPISSSLSTLSNQYQTLLLKKRCDENTL